MEDEDEPVSPFWLSNSNKKPRKPINNLLQRSSSFVLNSSVFIILLLVLAFLFIFIIIPMIRNATSQIFKPQSLVKKSWDYVTLVLVLFAIVCAFLSRNNDDENQNQNHDESFGEDSRNGVASGSLKSRNQWYGNADRRFDNRSFNRMKSSNSYPDIREESLLVVSGDDHRFYDDTHLIDHRFLNEDKIAHHRRQQSLPELRSELSPPQEKIVGKRQTKRVRSYLVIQEDPEEIKSTVHDATLYPPSAALLRPLVGNSPPPSPPSLPQSSAVKRRAERNHGARANEEKLKRPVKTKQEPNVRPRAPPPPPPPPPVLLQTLPPPPTPLPGKKIGRGDRKRSGSNSSSTNDLFELLLYQQKIEKKQRQKSVENLDAILQPTEPPPPPAVTKPEITKHKSSSSSSSSSSLTTKGSRINTFDHDINNLSSGNDSPLRIPPPPPPPPFRMKSRKFEVIGDYVRINSTSSSGSDSPDFDNYDRPSTTNPSSYVTDEMDVGDSPPLRSPVSCPSPDVDSKAGKFIARVRAGLKLEKVSSINDKQGIGLSKLGPDPSPNTSPDLNPIYIS